MRLVIAMLVVAGCGKSESLPADCSTVANGVKKYWEDRAAETTDAEERAAIAETSRRAAGKLEHHCKADKWSDDMIRCMRVVFRLEDSGCMKYLSAFQKAKLEAGNTAPVEGGIGVGN